MSSIAKSQRAASGAKAPNEVELPSNVELERAILGTILLTSSRSYFEEAAAILAPHDMSRSQNRHIWEQMIDLFEHAVELSTETLVEGLRRGGNLDAAGGPEYISELPDGCPTVAPIKQYALKVKDKSQLRDTATKAYAVYSRAIEPGAEMSDVCDEIDELSAITKAANGSGGVTDPLVVADMPEDVLDGRLGDHTVKKLLLHGSPISYSWLSVAVCAGTLTPPSAMRTNLYAALVGDTKTGKSTTFERTCQLFGLAEPVLQRKMVGSAEGLMGNFGDADGAHRLLHVDELSHLMGKAGIQNASYISVLNRSYYESKYELVAARGKRIPVNCCLSIYGGVVEDDFGRVFGSATTGGLHDRFVFARCPKPFVFAWRPVEISAVEADPVVVSIAGDVWEARDEWLKTISGVTGRIAENALRVAVIAASFDRRRVLMARDLGPARAFAAYQAQVRVILKPNAGENQEAQCANAILAVLDAVGGDAVDERKLSKKIHSERYGPGVWRRTLEHLQANGDIRRRKNGRSYEIRRAT